MLAVPTMSNILITGTSQGIGLETALTLARAGHRVFATVRNPAGAEALAEAARSLPISVHTVDVDSDESVQRGIGEILDSGVRIDALVNNAGVERVGPVEHTPLADFRTCMETNYFGVIRCTQAMLPHFRRNGGGVFVNISSVSGRIASAPLAPYTASKFALEAFTECLAQEVAGFGIRVHLVEPGIIETRMSRNISAPEGEQDYPHGRRMAAIFAAALSQHPSPAHVAGKIQELIERPTATLRHPVGPDAAPFLGWRAAQTDEEWIAYGAQSNEEWLRQVARDFGMNLKAEDL